MFGERFFKRDPDLEAYKNLAEDVRFTIDPAEPIGRLWWKTKYFTLRRLLPNGYLEAVHEGRFHNTAELKRSYIQKLRESGRL